MLSLRLYFFASALFVLLLKMTGTIYKSKYAWLVSLTSCLQCPFLQKSRRNYGVKRKDKLHCESSSTNCVTGINRLKLMWFIHPIVINLSVRELKGKGIDTTLCSTYAALFAPLGPMLKSPAPLFPSTIEEQYIFTTTTILYVYSTYMCSTIPWYIVYLTRFFCFILLLTTA